MKQLWFISKTSWLSCTMYRILLTKTDLFFCLVNPLVPLLYEGSWKFSVVTKKLHCTAWLTGVVCMNLYVFYFSKKYCVYTPSEFNSNVGCLALLIIIWIKIILAYRHFLKYIFSYFATTLTNKWAILSDIRQSFELFSYFS